MFKWPDPPDGQIIVRLPFEIYWAASLSVTLILGFGMYGLTVKEKLEEWLKTVVAISQAGAGKLGAKKKPVDGSREEKPEQDSSSKENAATTKSSNDAALAAIAQLPPPNEKTTASNSQIAKPDIETGAIEVDTTGQNARPPRCTVM